MQKEKRSEFEKRLDRFSFIKTRDFFRASKSKRNYMSETGQTYEISFPLDALEEAFGQHSRIATGRIQWDFVREDGLAGFVLVAEMSARHLDAGVELVPVKAFMPPEISDDCSDREFDAWAEFPVWVGDRTMSIEGGEPVSAI
jgi:hypothetical protein